MQHRTPFGYAKIVLVLCLSFACGHALHAYATEKQTDKGPVITIQVTDMHCADCAKKISRKLYALPGVVKVKTNLETHTATITPEAKKLPNPLSIWKAIEELEFEPVELNCPAGKFTTRKALEARFSKTTDT